MIRSLVAVRSQSPDRLGSVVCVLTLTAALPRGMGQPSGTAHVPLVVFADLLASIVNKPSTLNMAELQALLQALRACLEDQASTKSWHLHHI